MAAKAISHVRWDPQTLERIDRFAAERKLKRSAAIRILVGTALGDPSEMVAAREAAMLFSNERRSLLAAFSEAFQLAVGNAVQNVFGSSLTQPPDLSEYGEGGTDGLGEVEDDEEDDEGPPTRPIRGFRAARGRR